MSTITLNVGLDAKGGRVLSSLDVLQQLADAGGFIRGSRLEQSKTELTLVVTADAVPASTIYALAVALNQDCIAVSADGGKTGALIGPRADAWGWTFNPEFFIPQ